LPVFEHDPNDIKVVYKILQTIDSHRKTSTKKKSLIDVEDCGAAYRFFMAILATIPGKWMLVGTPGLLRRPILPLVKFLQKHGANIEKVEQGWYITGKELQFDDFEIDTKDTSQYLSALMLAQQRECGAFFRNPYLNMTKSILERPNIDASFALKLADWSAAVFWIANALLIQNARYLLKDLHFDCLQGDAEIVKWFAKFGILLNENKQGIEVKHLQQIDINKQHIDFTNTPDIAILMATLAVCYPFELTMTGLENLNLKESNRLDIMIEELKKITSVKKHSEESITIYKRIGELPKKYCFDSYNDHRFVMAWSLFKNFGNVDITNTDCIKKSYPGFVYDKLL